MGNQSFKTVWLLVAILAILGWWFLRFSTFSYKQHQQEQRQTQLTKMDQLQKLQEYFDSLNTLPLPKWDRMFLDSNAKLIHLRDITNDLKNIPNLYAIQANLCQLDLPDEIKQLAIDPQFSTWANQKCFAYSVSRDQTKYQIGAVVQKDNGDFQSYIVGNSTSPLIKDISSQRRVENGSTEALPYLPALNDKIKVSILKSPQEITITEDWTVFKPTKNLFYIPFSPSTPSIININAKGEDFLIKLTYPNGSVQTISPLNWKSELALKDRQYDGTNSKMNLIQKIGKFTYSLVSLGNDSQNSFKANWWELIIRGTNFNIVSAQENVGIYLNRWSAIFSWPAQQIPLADLDNQFVQLQKDKITLNLQEISKKFIEDSLGGINTLSYFDALYWNFSHSVRQLWEVNLPDSSLKEIKETIKTLMNTTKSNIIKVSSPDWEVFLLIYKGKLDYEPAKLIKVLFDENQNPKFTLTDIFNQICKEAGFSEALYQDEIYKIAKPVNFGAFNNRFEIYPQIAQYLPQDKNISIVFQTTFRTSPFSVVYLNWFNWFITYWPLKYTIEKTRPEGKNYFEGLAIACKK